MKLVSRTTLAELSAAARVNPRRRQNRNLHASHDEPVQRMLNALEPGTWLRPHRHAAAGRWELMTILSGRVALLTFDDRGTVRERHELSPQGPLLGVEIPADTWHTLVALEPGSVILEVKQGPYTPAGAQEFADWSPAEGRAAEAMERWLQTAQAGDRMPG